MSEQRWVPGLVGMAVDTDCLYLTGLQDDGAGGLNGLKVLYHGIDFGRFAARVGSRDWAGAEQQVVEAACALAAGGASFLVITSGTGNTFAETVSRRSGLPVLDPVDVACAEMARLGSRRAGLISTRRTDEAGLFHRAAHQAGLEVLSASDALKDEIQAAIFEDLIHGLRSPRAVETAVRAAEAFAGQDADGLILGCTDFALVADEITARCSLRIVDLTRAHAQAARRSALAGRLEP